MDNESNYTKGIKLKDLLLLYYLGQPNGILVLIVNLITHVYVDTYDFNLKHAFYGQSSW